jgi:tRNA (guanine-N7-)-methyltransferase
MIVNQIKSYVLRSGRMTDAQQKAYTELSPVYGIPVKENETPLNVESIFRNSNPLTIEIGFGMGDALAEIAQANPLKNYLGIEVFKNGIGKLLWEIQKRSLQNVRIAEGDAVEIIGNRILPHSVAAFHIFFPDPWPKKRHHKRRLIKRPFTDMLAQHLVSNGYIYMATDWQDYAEQAMAELSATSGLRNPYADLTGGYAPRMEWRGLTKFERKGLAKDHAIFELYFTA